MKRSSKHLAFIRKYTIGAVLILATPLAFIAGTSPAVAAPTGEYGVFAECPLPAASGCIYSKTESGKVVIGKETVPIEKPVVLQGGFRENEAGQDEFLGAKNAGNTLQKVPQKVPGGLSGLVKCNEITNPVERIGCELVFENGLTGVNATVELAAPATSIGLSELLYFARIGPALTLPVKVHLENPFLGSACYVGSNASPIVIGLTTGTSGAYTGTPGTLEGRGEGGIGYFSHNSLVNNTFAAPEANGCGGLFSFLIDPIINAKLGLPSPSGHNAAVLSGFLELASAQAVEEH
jgi:hypothetical protein